MKKDKNFGVIFPGQGSQFPGMGKPYEKEINSFKDNFDLASELLGLDLWELVTEEEPINLNKTEYTQPAIFTLNASLFQLWIERGGTTPNYVAGHSLGEYNALVACGAIDFDAALRLVVKRGKLMSEIKSQGAMAAVIGLNVEQLTELCALISKELKLTVDCANINTVDQIVIAGDIDAVDMVCARAKSIGAKRAIKLDVSVPSHCALMIPVAEDFKEALNSERFSKPNDTTTLIQNVDASVSKTTDEIQNKLLSQLHMPVRWHQTMVKLIGMGCHELMECGAGKVLTNIAKRINKEIKIDSYFLLTEQN